jgi:hypothetical protein
MDVFRGKREGNYFYGWDWTGRNRLNGLEKIAGKRILTVTTVALLIAQLDSKRSSDAGGDSS